MSDKLSSLNVNASEFVPSWLPTQPAADTPAASADTNAVNNTGERID